MTLHNFVHIICFIISTHADRQGVDISFTVFVCNFVRLRISPARIKLAASNFARWFMGVLGKESPILRNFAHQKQKIRRIGQSPGSKVQCWNGYCNCQRWLRVQSAIRHVWITSDPEDGRTCFLSMCRDVARHGLGGLHPPP